MQAFDELRNGCYLCHFTQGVAFGVNYVKLTLSWTRNVCRQPKLQLKNSFWQYTMLTAAS